MLLLKCIETLKYKYNALQNITKNIEPLYTLDVSTVGPFSTCPSCGNHNLQTDKEPSLAEVFVVFFQIKFFNNEN